jgi:hypothetical protein
MKLLTMPFRMIAALAVILLTLGDDELGASPQRSETEPRS